MKKAVFALSLIVLVLICHVPTIASPGTVQQIEDKISEPDIFNPSILSAEGDTSSESITSFSETTADDVLFYPDMFFNTTNHLIKADSNATPIELGDYTNTYYSDPATWRAYTNSSYGPPYESTLVCRFNVTEGDYGVEGIKLSFEAVGVGGQDSAWWSIYNFDTKVYDDIANITASYDWYYHTTYDPNYWDTDTNSVYVKLCSKDASIAAYSLIEVDAAWLETYTMHLGDDNHYAESFADVSDWTDSGFEAGDAFSSDGDLLELKVGYQGSASVDIIQSDTFAGISTSSYYEIRWKVNATYATTGGRVYLWLTDTDGDRYQWYTDPTDTDWHTQKDLVASMQQLDNSVGDIIHARLLSYCPNSGDAVNFQVDYLRVGPATEMGWQHDGSTTEAYSNDGDGDKTYTYSSDGDILTFGVDHSAGTGSSYSKIEPDTTATSTHIERDYYEFIKVRYRWTIYTLGDDGLSVNWASDGRRTTIDSEGAFANNTWVTVIKNVETGSADSGVNYGLYVYCTGDEANYTMELDYAKVYSIANFTVTQDATSGVDDIAYVDSGALVFDRSDADWIKIQHDPALAVAVATYNVWNLTLSAESSGNYWNRYVGGGWEGAVYWHTTRGDYDRTGNLTDFEMVIRYDETLSAIKFWEDSVAPTIGNVWATPYSPTEIDDVTLSIYTADWTDLFSVILNAIDSPATFNDVDYSCDKNSEDTDLWTYTFDDADMPAGYYAIVATANDGANTVTDLIVFRVVAVTLQITDIVLITATEDLAQISGHINKDSSYNIYENDSSVGSGSVATGWFSISWTKDSTAGSYIELGIIFTAGAYTEWVNGSYSVASAEVLSIINTVYTGNDASNTLSGTTNLPCDYYIYENDTQVDTGSLGAGSFSLTWNRNSTDGLISWGAKFTDGTTTRWLNGTYYNTPTTYDDLMLSAVSFTSGTEEIAVFIQTNWNNCTIHVYDNDTIKTSGAEGSLSYENPQTPGLHRVGVYVNGTAQNLWVNFTYSVAEDAGLSITALTFDISGVNISIFVNSNWGNCTITVYEEDVEKDTGDEGVLTYIKATTSGNYNVSIKIDGTADLVWANFTYTIGTEDSLSITALTFGTSGADVTAFATTNWMNATLTLYENDVQKDTGSEGTTLSYTKATTAGDYNIGLKIDGTADLIWANYTYTITAEDSLSITALTFDISGVNISIFVNSNWGNCTITVYEEDVQKTTGSEGTLTYLKTTTAGNYDVGVKIDGTADLIWANYTYSVATVELDVDIEDWGVEDVVIEVVGISNLDINWYIYNEGVYSEESGSETGDLGFQFTFAKNTAIGKHNFSIYFNDTLDGSQYRWFNRSYTISAIYAISNIYTYNQGGDYIDWEQFTFLINGTQIYGNEFYNRTDHVYLITIQDVFGSNLYSAVHSWGRTFKITIDVYTFIVANMLDDQFIYFNMTRVGGGTWSKHIVPTSFIEFSLLYAATYSYTYSTVATDGTVRTATGSVTVEEDTAVIIFEFGLVKILSEIRLISPGGGVGKKFVEESFATVNATLSMMWTFLWGFGIFLIVALWVVPFVNRRRRRGTYSPSSKPSGGSSKPKAGIGGFVLESAKKNARKQQKKLGIRQDDEREFGPRQ